MIFSYRSVLGLDLSGNQLRFVELTRGVRGLRIGGFGVVDLPVEEGELARSGRDVLIDALKELIASGAIRSRRVVFGIPRDHYFFRRLTLPPVSSDKLKPIIENQLERIFPMRNDQLVYDYQEVGKGKNGGKEVVLIGAKSSEIEESTAVAKAAGLELLRIDMREIALCNLLKAQERPLVKPIVFLNIDKDAVSIDLLASGHPVTCRRIALGGGDVRPDIVLGEVEKAIGFYSEMAVDGEGIERFVLSGDPVLLDRVFPETDRFLGVEVERLSGENLTVALPSGFELEKLGHALGLALSGYQVAIHTMDLLPSKVKDKRERDEWIRTGVLSVVILFLLFAFSMASGWRKQAELEGVQRDIAAIEGRVNAARELKKEYEGLASKINTINKFQETNPHWLVILNNLSELIPESAWLTSLSMEQGKPLKLSGNASSAATLIPLLESSPYLKNVKFEAPTTKRDYGGEEVESFRITADVVWSGEGSAQTQ